MSDSTKNIKELLEVLATSELTCSSRLVAVIQAIGIEDPKQIELLTGLGESGARKAKRQLKEYRDCGPAPECRDTPVPHQSVGPTPECRSEQPDPEPAYIATHATNEYPSDIVIPRKLAASSAHDEIEGLNGHTSMYLDWLAEWLSPFAPDRQTAREILISNIDLYTAPKVKAGMVELKSFLASGGKSRNLVKTFTAFVKNASTDATPAKVSKFPPSTERPGKYDPPSDAAVLAAMTRQPLPPKLTPAMD